ncbi:MAG: rhodanese-like domain-containing protein [Verrucomicrobiota bacterium]
MRGKHFIMVRLAALGALGWAMTLAATGMTVAELQKQLAGGAKITVIDVRSPELYSQAHIPGAINIPASLCPLKNLPPLGQVVVYGEGLGREESTVDDAAAALGRKPGITADVLQGGFATWESAQALTTRAAGMKSETFNYITYAELKAANPGEVVLVDLRKAPGTAHPALAAGTNAASPPLTDLSQEFPGLHLANSVAEASAVSRSGVPALVILIDSADGTAQQAARALKTGGARRYAILAGGELILARHGQPGLQRAGSRVVPQFQTPAPATGGNTQ